MEQDDRYRGYENREYAGPSKRLLSNSGAATLGGSALDTSPIQWQVNEIHGQVQALEKNLTVLHERLAMVSRPVADDPNKEGPVPPAASALAAALAESSVKLAELNRMVRNMSRGLEL